MVKRDSYMNRLIHSMWNGEIKVITGIRRCGKSVLLFDLFFEYLLSQNVSEDHILKIELDQRRYYKFRNPITLCEYVESIVRDKKGEKFYLFIDEVQLTTKVVDKENGGIEVTIYDMLNELKAYDNSTQFYRDYFGRDIDALVNSIKKYKQTHGAHNKGEGYLADLLKEK